MTARFAVLLAFAYLLQAVCAAPYGCGCGCGGSTISPPAPVNCPQVVARNAGCSSSYVTPPVCQPLAFETPVSTYTTAASGPVSEETVTFPGYCPTSCDVTRSRCGGSSKCVNQGPATIIFTGSYTDGGIDQIGNTVSNGGREVGPAAVSGQVYEAGCGCGGVEYVGGPGLGYGYGVGAGYGVGPVVEYGGWGGAGYGCGGVGYGGGWGGAGYGYGGAGYGCGCGCGW